MDYAIIRDGKPIIIIECKAVSNGNLIDERGQLRRYFNTTKPIIAVITNGIQYQFFSDLDRDNEMDSEPFLDINLGDFDDEDFDAPGASAINALSIFTKSEFNPDGTRDAAVRGMPQFK